MYTRTCFLERSFRFLHFSRRQVCDMRLSQLTSNMLVMDCPKRCQTEPLGRQSLHRMEACWHCWRGNLLHCSRFVALNDYSRMPNRVTRRAIIAQDGRYASQCQQATDASELTPTWEEGGFMLGEHRGYIISRREALCSQCVQTCLAQSSRAKLKCAHAVIAQCQHIFEYLCTLLAQLSTKIISPMLWICANVQALSGN